ncbi:alpha/beta fold hydrolase [Mycobacterium sp. Marseille-P9652]|uniref:alpha/beta fold hydrolase n=1 Tax=Mycobacterium sp. Marseille-P9652 TaxID=2654950 RepID=UPI0012E81DCA|nr:alpha/beta hydrolase [Mycobacterium sp. Marseille-P9652]
MTRHSELVRAGTALIETYVDGDGPAVVIVPSYGRDGGADFDPLTAALVGAGYRVLRPQPRGIARSAGPMTAVTFEDMARDVAAVIENLADGPAVVLGHAFGNFVARATAVHHPDRVAGVVLAAASGRTVTAEVNSAPMRAGDPALPEAERLAALRLAFFAPGHDASIWLTGWYPRTLAMQVDCARRADVSRYWGAGSAPVFELIAALDPFHHRDEWGDLRARYGDRITTTVIDNASHALFPEQPDTVADAILAYLRSRSAARTKSWGEADV